MITNFKIFEKKNLIFNYAEGDYISLFDGVQARIIQCKSWDDMEQPDYYVEIFDKKNFRFHNNHWVDETQIERKLEPEEMKDINIYLDSKTYNL